MVPMIKVFGDSEWASRLLSWTAASCTLGIVWHFFRLRGIAVFATALFGFSRAHFAYTHEARPYTLIVLLALICVLYLLDRIERPRAWSSREVLSSIVILSALNYLHYCGVIFSFSVILSLLCFRRKLELTWRQWLAIVAGVQVSLLPWAEALSIHIRNKPAHLGDAPDALVEIYHRFTFFFLGRSLVATALFLVLGGVLALALWQKRPSRNSLLLAHSLWLFPLATTVFVLRYVMTGTFIQRYVFELLPGLYVAILLSWLELRRFHRASAYVLAAVFILFHVSVFADRKPWLTQFVNIQDREAAQAVLAARTPCKLVITSGFPVTAEYYFKRAGFGDLAVLKDGDVSLSMLQSNACPHLFYLTGAIKIDHSGQFLERLKQHYDLKHIFPFSGVEVMQWERH